MSLSRTAEGQISEVDAPFADFALLSADGRVLDDAAGFLDACGPAERLRLAWVARANPAATSYEMIALADGAMTLVAAAPMAHARSWQAASGWGASWPASGGIVVCRLSLTGIRQRLVDFGEAFGLAPAVIRVVTALYDRCDVKRAAEAAGVSFNTAREYLGRARAAIGAPNLQQLVTWAGVGSLAMDASGENDRAVGVLFSLSERQRRLAGLVADGASRTEAAEVLGVSDAVAKKELAAVFAATGVVNAIGLARLFAELRGLAILARDPTPKEPYPPPFSRTLTVGAADGRKVVVSDYGPPNGKPVLVLHNTMNCRGVDRALAGALQDRGYRPLSPDRPGYGDTDPAPTGCQGEDYLRVCADDIAALCQEIGATKVSVIAHGPVHVVLALLRYWPDLIETAVIDAPEPGSGWGAKAKGTIPSLKRRFAQRPWAVASMVRILTALTTYERLGRGMRAWTANSPADRKAMRDPALLMDFYRKMAPFRRGRIDGFVREQVLQATGGRPAPVADAGRLTLLMGATDFMHDAGEIQDYWRAVLPDARFVILPDAGRFISYSHPERLADELLAG
jgi:pimeloyl-ACP methyl ester carboxylesterase/DNA-binding CsgD family transcriptional regulator